MTVTDELRRLLDERGVDWKAFDDFEQTTQWSTYDGAFVYWARERNGKLLVETTAPSASYTPEQAIAATLGNVDLLAENAKLRELARRFGEYVSQDRCEGCVCKLRCNNGDIEECWQLTEIRALANELGIKVAE